MKQISKREVNRFDRMIANLLEIPEEELNDAKWEGSLSSPRSLRIRILRRRRLRRYHGDLIAAVSKSLFRFDPCSLSRYGVFDEYDGEATEIIFQISIRKSFNQLKEEIHSICESCNHTKVGYSNYALALSVISDYNHYMEIWSDRSSLSIFDESI